jgi:hypothetical protein
MGWPGMGEHQRAHAYVYARCWCMPPLLNYQRRTAQPANGAAVRVAYRPEVLLGTGRMLNPAAKCARHWALGRARTQRN